MSDRDIIEFFDSWALVWDERMIIDEDIVKTILDCAKVCAGKKILDVACGTGVLIPYYLKRDVLDVTGIDISPKMIEIAQNKFQMEKVKFICDNAVDHEYDEKYDCIVIYNAFPHFEDPERLIERMSLLLHGFENLYQSGKNILYPIVYCQGFCLLPLTKPSFFTMLRDNEL